MHREFWKKTCLENDSGKEVNSEERQWQRDNALICKQPLLAPDL